MDEEVNNTVGGVIYCDRDEPRTWPAARLYDIMLRNSEPNDVVGSICMWQLVVGLPLQRHT